MARFDTSSWCSQYCGWSIILVHRYMFDAAAKEREAFQKQDMENDDRIFQLAENSNKALTGMSKSLDANTTSLDQFRNALVNGRSK